MAEIRFRENPDEMTDRERQVVPRIQELLLKNKSVPDIVKATGTSGRFVKKVRDAYVEAVREEASVTRDLQDYQLLQKTGELINALDHSVISEANVKDLISGIAQLRSTVAKDKKEEKGDTNIMIANIFTKPQASVKVYDPALEADFKPILEHTIENEVKEVQEVRPDEEDG